MTIFIEWVKNRIRKGFSPIILIVGKQRIGKTCLGLRLSYEIDRNFDCDKQLFFEVRQFAKSVRKYDNKVLLLDEAGIELDSYRYSDARQRCFSHIVQSQAYKQNTLFIVLPHSSDLAKCHRKYVDALIVVMGRGTYTMYKPSVPYWDMNDIDFRTKKIEIVIDVPLPPDHIFNAYKNKFEKQVKEGIIDAEIDRLDKFLEKAKGKKAIEIPVMASQDVSSK